MEQLLLVIKSIWAVFGPDFQKALGQYFSDKKQDAVDAKNIEQVDKDIKDNAIREERKKHVADLINGSN